MTSFRRVNRLATVLSAALLFATAPVSLGLAEEPLPNVVVIFVDDLGYGDLGCYGADDIPTPHLDRMAAEGVRFTDFYVTAPFCSPSRVSLLTGCYPLRVDLPRVLHPHENKGLNPDETTIAEVFKSRGYATACLGKWHVGHRDVFLPPRHGFDESLVIPYSHDMYRGAPWAGGFGAGWPDFVPLLRDGKPFGQLRGLDDFSTMTRLFTDAAIDFIRRQREEPFFLYLPQPMPHLEIKVPEPWAGVSKRGPYGDIVAELDGSVGEILSVLKELDLDDRTLVVFTSDNGPAAIYQRPEFPGGSAGPFSGRKATWHEGGLRVPCVVRWPGKLPAGKVCREVATIMDLLPTMAALIGAELPEQPIDGRDMWPLLTQPDEAKTPYEAFYYYRNEQLIAVRAGDWKLWVKRKEYAPDGSVRKVHPAELYHLRDDPAEKNNVAAENPAVVARLNALGDRIRRQLGDRAKHQPAAEGTPGPAIRKAFEATPPG
ncbi:MAG: sulfatase [Paracoccaceae bacterium]